MSVQLQRSWLLVASLTHSHTTHSLSLTLRVIYSMSTVRDSYDTMERAKYESSDNQPLLSRTVQESEEQANKLLRNFYFMCFCFSANHGCVVSCIAYAASELGDLLGGYGTGSLYVCYALTAFFFSKPVITMTGPKIGLVLGVGGYCIYILGFLLAIILNGIIRWPVFLFAACMGGMAGGLLWTAQGRYFSKNAAMYSEGNYPYSFSSSMTNKSYIFRK